MCNQLTKDCEVRSVNQTKWDKIRTERTQMGPEHHWPKVTNSSVRQNQQLIAKPNSFALQFVVSTQQVV